MPEGHREDEIVDLLKAVCRCVVSGCAVLLISLSPAFG